MEGLGEKIKKYRESKGFSQDYVANMLDISQSTLAKYESNTTEISVKRLAEIANVLGVNFTDFFNLDHRVVNISDFKDNAVNNYIENQNLEAKELSSKLIRTLENQIEHLKSEITYLRNQRKP